MRLGKLVMVVTAEEVKQVRLQLARLSVRLTRLAERVSRLSSEIDAHAERASLVPPPGQLRSASARPARPGAH